MKFQIDKETLLQPLQQIIGAVEKRQTMPALSNVLIRTIDNGVSFTATDLEIELVSEAAIIVDEPGEITVPARKLLDICKALDQDAHITFTLKDNHARVQAGRSRFSLTTLPVSDFPSLDPIEPLETLRLAQKNLRQLIDKTAFAMAQQDVRYYLNGLMLELGQNRLTGVATDGHRLSCYRSEMPHETTDLRQIILPRKGVLELLRLLEDVDDEIELRLASNHLQVAGSHWQFSSKLIDGRFPDYTRVMPEETENRIIANRNDFRQALIRASILCNEKYRGVRMMLDKGSITLQAQNPDQEEADVDIEVEYDGEPIEIGFNVNYMLDVLNVTDSEQVCIDLRDANSSFLITYSDLPEVKYVIMPMRL